MIIENWPAHCNTENAKQGYWGEMYVQRMFSNQGYLTMINPDPFGGWDMIRIDPITGKSTTIQVKTLVRYVTKNYFGIKNGIMGKTVENLKECDELILVVRNPHSIDDTKYKGHVLRVLDHRNYTLIKNEYIIPSIPDNFIHLAYLTPDELKSVNSFKTYKEYKG